MYSLQWLGRETSDQIAVIFKHYSKFLSVSQFEQKRAPSMSARQSAQATLPTFIGRIVRQIERCSTDSLCTIDEVYVYEQDPCKLPGEPFQFLSKYYLYTHWNYLDGVPERFIRCSKYDLVSQDRSSVSARYSLYCFPMFMQRNAYEYKSFVGNFNMIISSNTPYDRCVQKLMYREECKKQIQEERGTNQDDTEDLLIDILDNDCMADASICSNEDDDEYRLKVVLEDEEYLNSNCSSSKYNHSVSVIPILF